MLEIVQDLCMSVTGSQCNIPRVSSWRLVAPAQSSVSVDVFDAATGGAGAAIPYNVKAMGSYFLAGLENSRIGLSTQMQGYGAGAGIGLGWGIPFVGAKKLGNVPSHIGRVLLKKIGAAGQDKIVASIRGLVDSASGLGNSGGTRIITGPNACDDLTTSDFHNAYVTVFSLGASFVVNGVSAGLIVLCKEKPAVVLDDLIMAKAFGIIAGTGVATSLDLEASGNVYKVGFR